VRAHLAKGNQIKNETTITPPSFPQRSDKNIINNNCNDNHDNIETRKEMNKNNNGDDLRINRANGIIL